MKKAWQTIKGYIWWTYPRGSFHYDVMVTLILLIIFVTPHFINYKDKPAERQPRPKSVLVMPDGDNGLIFRVDARDVNGGTPADTQADLQRVIEPISGYVKIKRWAPELDSKGNLVGYHVWVRR
jgi:hypothetical protein